MRASLQLLRFDPVHRSFEVNVIIQAEKRTFRQDEQLIGDYRLFESGTRQD